MSEVAERISPPASRFDELRDDDGQVRPHWRAFARTLTQLSPEEYERRQASARATVQDNGVTYNVYDDRAGQARPWQLDIVPFILSSGDWKAIEAAVIQRAMLADMILRDVYGPLTGRKSHTFCYSGRHSFSPGHWEQLSAISWTSP